MIKNTLIASLLLLGSSWFQAQEEETQQKPSLLLLAAESDLVALAQVVITDYEYTRGFPSKGIATLRILIPYKLPIPLEQIEVTEEGLKEQACYFPEASAWQEGQRFLVFLEHVEVDQFRGHSSLCALPVFVTDNNQYALRIPEEKISLTEAGQAMVREFVYVDPAARIDARDMTRTSIQKMSEEMSMRQIDDELIYTLGIELSDVRRLIGAQALAAD